MNSRATAAAYVPHEFGAVLIDSVEAVDAHLTRATAHVHAGTPFGDGDEGWPAWVVAEIMAQTVAAGVGIREFQPGVRPRLGLLLGIRQFECSQPLLAPGSHLVFEAFESTRDERGMAVFDCTIASDGARIASAILSVYLPQNVDEYLRSIEP